METVATALHVAGLSIWAAAAAVHGSNYDWSLVDELHPGIRHAQVNLTTPRTLAIQVLRIDLGNPDIRFTTTGRAANWSQNNVETTKQTTRNFISSSRAAGVPALVAINASPWTPWPAPFPDPGHANLSGLAVSNGRLVSPADGYHTLMIGRNLLPSMATTTSGTPTSDILQAASGFGFCLRNGIPEGNNSENEPRTGYGLSQDGLFLLLMTVDGRQSGYSEGCTVYEVGDFLKFFGGHTGLNMDGGGSTTMAKYNPATSSTVLLNTPSDRFFGLVVEREVGNNWGVYLAIDKTWTGGGANDNWDNAANWDTGTVPLIADRLRFGGSARLNPVNSFPEDTTFCGITFLAGSGAFTLSGNRIFLGGNVTNLDDDLQTLSLPVVLSGNGTFAAQSGPMTAAGGVSGSGSLYKSGSHALTFSGPLGYTGRTVISAGTLRLGSTLTTTGGLQMSGTGALDLNGNNATFTSSSSTGGHTAASSNTITDNGTGAGTSVITINNNASQTAGLGALVTDGITRKVGFSVINNSHWQQLLTNASNTFSGGILVSGGTGYGSRLYLTAYQAATSGNGTLTASQLGTGAITVGTATNVKGQVQFDGSGMTGKTVYNDIIFNTTLGADNPGGVRQAANNITLGGTLTANLADASFLNNGANGNNLNISGRITGNSGFQLTAAGFDQIVTLANTGPSPNDFAGTTSILRASSILRLGAANQIPDGLGRANVNVVGTLQLNGFNDAINGLTGNGTVHNNSATTAATLTLGAGDATATFTGTIRDGSTAPLHLTKTGSGTQTLSGPATHTGDTTVTQGTLVLAQPTLADFATVAVSGGAVLRLDHGGQDAIGEFHLDGVRQWKGIWGPPGSSATYQTTALAGSGTLVVNFGPEPGYDGWAWRKGLAGLPPEQSGPDGDPEGDGNSNLLEWALGLFPLDPDRPSINLTQQAGRMDFVYDRAKEAFTAGVVYQVEWSRTLAAGSWSTAGVTSEVTNDDGQIQTIMAVIPWSDGDHRMFVRLRVTADPEQLQAMGTDDSIVSTMEQNSAALVDQYLATSVPPPAGDGTPLGIKLAESGTPNFTLIVPENAASQETNAAAELATYLGRITGAVFPVVAEGNTPVEGPVISVGRTLRLAQTFPHLDLAMLGPDSTVQAVRGVNLFLAGEGTRGTLYAVCDFLEKQCGVRWWTPTEETVPLDPNLTPAPPDHIHQPPFSYRETNSRIFNDTILNFSHLKRTDGREQRHLHAVRSKVNTLALETIPDEWGGSMRLVDMRQGTAPGSYQEYNHFIGVDEFGQTHPEWFCERGGYRQTGARHLAQLCTTNEAMRAMFLERAKAWVDTMPGRETFVIMHNDNSYYCQCPVCGAVDAEEGSPCGSQTRFMNFIAEELEKHRPGIQIWMDAYGYSTTPPRITRPRHNLGPILCTPIKSQRLAEDRKFLAEWAAWRRITDRVVIWDYVTNFAGFVNPWPNLRLLGPNLRTLAANGAHGVFSQGNIFNSVSDSEEIKSWLISQMLWDPSQDPDALIAEFAAGYYGAAAGPVMACLDLIAANGGNIPGGLKTAETATHWLDLAAMNRATELLDEAATAAAGDPVLAERVARIRINLDHQWLLGWRQYRAVANRTGAPFLGPGTALAALATVRSACTRFACTHDCEQYGYGTMVRQLDTIEAALTVFGRIAPPPPYEAIAPENFILIEDNRLMGISRGAKSVNDLPASDGRAMRTTADHRDWNIQVDEKFLRTVCRTSGLAGRWRVIADVRVDAIAATGNAMQMGIYSYKFPPNAVSKVVRIEALNPTGYTPVEIGILDLDADPERTSIWLGPLANPELVNAIFVDRVILTR